MPVKSTTDVIVSKYTDMILVVVNDYRMENEIKKLLKEMTKEISNVKDSEAKKN